MKILALLSLRTYSPCKEEAEIASRDLVRLRIPGVLRNIAAPSSSSLRQVLVLAIATRPLVVPDIEDRSGLRRRLGFHCRGVDLRSRGTLLLPDNLLHFPLCLRRHQIASRCECCGYILRFCIFRRHRRRRSYLDVGHFVGCHKDE